MKVLKEDSPVTVEVFGEKAAIKYLLDEAFVKVTGDQFEMIRDLFGVFSTDWKDYLKLPQASSHSDDVSETVDKKVATTARVGKLVQLLVALTHRGFTAGEGKLEFREKAYTGNEVQPSFAEPQ